MKNKFKTMIWILGVCLITATVIVACEEVNVNEDLEKDVQKALGPVATGAVAIKWWEVDKQIEWIAKGFVPIADNVSGLKNLLHTEVAANDPEEEFLSVLHDDCENSLTYDLQNSHESKLDTDFPSNNYDKLYFGGFEIGGEDYSTYLWIPEVNTVDKTQLHVVCPMRISERYDDETTGYFLDTNGDLDSLLVDWDDDPTDDYYIWIVSYKRPLKTPDPLSPIRGEGISCGDGFCDRSSENEVSCPQDCDPIQNPSGVKDVYQIKLTEVEVHHDEHQYMESWLGNKYDFTFVGCVFDNLDNPLSYRGEYINLNSFTYVSDPILELELKRNNICRRKGTKEKGCPSDPAILNELIVDDFRAGDNLMLSGFEDNRLIVWSHPDAFYISREEFSDPQFDAIYWKMQTGRNNKSVNPFYEKNQKKTFVTNNPGFDLVDFEMADIITINSFSGPGSTIVIDNGEWKYTLELVLKQ